MHPYVLIPLVAALGAGGLASAIVAREPGLRANRLVAAILACAGFWSLCEVLWNTAEDVDVAIRVARWSSLGSLMMGPLSLHLILTVVPRFAGRFRGLLFFAYASAAFFVFSNVLTPWYVAEMVPTPWGRTPAIGANVPLEFAAVASCPLVAFVAWLAGRPSRSELRRVRALVLAPALILLVATLTEFALPLAGIHAPRLGSTAIVAWGGFLFWTVYRFREPVIAPRRFAREILSILPAGVVLLHLDERIRSANQKLAEWVGCEPGDLTGVRVRDVLTASGAAANDPVGAANDLECELRLAWGGRIPVSVTRSELRDDAGTAIGSVLVVRDLREVAALRGRLITSGRLAAVGQLAAGITHEINNPIAYVRSNVALLESHWSRAAEAVGKGARGPLTRRLLDDGRELLGDSREGVERVASIVRDVGGFSRVGPAGRELEDVNRLLDTALRVARPQLRGRAEVERRYGELPLVSCVAQELMQVFLNLLLNAAQALDGGGTIRLVTQARDGEVRVRVEDDGAGMPPEVRERVFDAFFTTKPAGEGTGLGLAISRQIVRRHAGEIDVASRPGRGTVFEVRLPAGGGA